MSRSLLIVGLVAVLGTAVVDLPAGAVTPRRLPIPRPTSIVLSASNSAACGVDDRYFGSGAACNATETSVDVTLSEPSSITVMDMTCSQPTDATCTIGFQLRGAAADVATFYCESVNTASCSPSSPTATVVGWLSNVAIKVTDVSETCASNAPTCTVFYTVP